MYTLGPKSPKSLKKVFLGLSAWSVPKVSKRVKKKPKSQKGVKITVRGLLRHFFHTPGLKAPDEFFETFWGFRGSGVCRLLYMGIAIVTLLADAGVDQNFQRNLGATGLYEFQGTFVWTKGPFALFAGKFVSLWVPNALVRCPLCWFGNSETSVNRKDSSPQIENLKISFSSLCRVSKSRVCLPDAQDPSPKMFFESYTEKIRHQKNQGMSAFLMFRFFRIFDFWAWGKENPFTKVRRYNPGPSLGTE